MNALPRALCVALLLVAAPTTLAQPLDLSWYTVDGGGIRNSSGGGFDLAGTIGQPDAGSMSGGGMTLTGGFWAIATAACNTASGGPPGTIAQEDFSAPPVNWTFRGVAGLNAASGTARLVSSGQTFTAGIAYFSGAGIITSAFEVEFDFSISNVAGTAVDNCGSFGPDGLAFFVTSAPPTMPGEVGRGLGYGGFPARSLAVEFDAYCNPAYSDPDSNHVGLDVGGSLVSVATAPVTPNFETPGNWHARVRYESGLVTVYLAAPAQSAVQVLAAIVPSANIPAVKYFGFSSGTGLNSADTDVDNVQIRQLDPDCNTNGIADSCDLSGGSSADANSNGIPDECESHLADMNCDGLRDGLDVQAFVTAVLDPVQYAVLYPNCVILNGDLTSDGIVNTADTPGFVQCLLNLACP